MENDRAHLKVRRLKQSQRGPAIVELLSLRRARQDGHGVPGVDVAQNAPLAVPFAKEKGGKSSAIRDLVQVPVELSADFSGRAALFRHRAQNGLQIGHENGGGYALAADVRNGQEQAPIRQLDDVVIIAAYAPRRDANGGELQASVGRELVRKKRLLNLKRKIEFRLAHGQFALAGSQCQLHAVKRQAQDSHRGGSGKGEYRRQ